MRGQRTRRDRRLDLRDELVEAIRWVRVPVLAHQVLAALVVNPNHERKRQSRKPPRALQRRSLERNIHTCVAQRPK